MVDGGGVLSTYNCIYWTQKEVETVSVPSWKYSPGRNNIKKEIQSRSVMACWIVVPPWYVALRQWRMDIGMEGTR